MLQWMESSYTTENPRTNLVLNHCMERNEMLHLAQNDSGKCDLCLSFDRAVLNTHSTTLDKTVVLTCSLE